jgi:hypothetical protein
VDAATGPYEPGAQEAPNLMARILALSGDPERDDWPSVESSEPELCPWCEAQPTERHSPPCPLYAPAFEELSFCDECQTEFATVCACDGHDDCEVR